MFKMKVDYINRLALDNTIINVHLFKMTEHYFDIGS